MAGAAHTLVRDSAGVDAAISTLDADSATTVRIAVGLSTHEFVRERDDGTAIVNDGATCAIAYIRSVSSLT